MAEQEKVKLFREKSLEAVESPEALNDYLRVTSPGVWLTLAAVIALLVGSILWGILGRIETTGAYAVSAKDGKVLCHVPYPQAEKALARGRVTVDGREYLMDTKARFDIAVVTDETDPYLVAAGQLKTGDMTVEVPVFAELEDGVYSGTVLLESLQPISMLIGKEAGG